MRAPALAVALLLVLVAFAMPVHAAEDFRAVGAVNKLIQIISTPQLEPGQAGDFDLRLNSTYPAGMVMRNVSLEASVYEYATIDSSVPVDRNWTFPYPILQSGTGQASGRSWWWNATSVDPGTVTNLSFRVVTSGDSNQMPSGSVFSQASYFLRFSLTFDGNVSGSMTPFHMASPGYFSSALWAQATNASYTQPCTPPWCLGNVNVSILGVDGILADSSFGVKPPIPQWPFYLLIAFAVFFAALAFLFWVEENPGTYPRVEAWWARQRGRLARVRPRRGRRGPGVPP